MIILFLFHFASSYVFGIDIGTEYTKISVTNPKKGIRAAINQNSKRSTPSYFAIWDINNSSNNPVDHLNSSILNSYRWELLDSAKDHYFRFPSHAVKGLKNLLKNTHGLMRREILALFLRQLITSIEEQKYIPSETALVFAVEPTLPLEDRVAIAETCKIANITLFAIIESPSAAARLYAMEKRLFFSYGQKIVMFFDIGATHTWSAIYRFEPNGQKPIVNELSVSYNSTLGGNLIDEIFADYLEKKFLEQNQLKQFESLNKFKQFESLNQKRMLFIKESCRAKEMLSLNDFVNVKIDDVYENFSLNINVTRNEFENLISFFTESIKNIYKETLLKGNIQGNTIDSIELIGGCTRIPLIQNLLKELSGMKKLNRTLNGDEAIAIGAGYFGAEMKDDFQFKPVKISSHIHNKIYLKHSNKTVILFNESNRNTDKVRHRIFTQSLDISDLDYSIYSGETQMLNFHLKPPEKINLTKNEQIIITFAFNRFNAPFIYNISMNTGRVTKVTFSKPDWMLNSMQINESISFVRKMEEEAKNRKKVSKIRNDFESFVIKILNKLHKDEIFIRVTPLQKQNEIKTVFTEHEKWLNSIDNDRIDVHELADEFIKLRNMTREIEIRAELFVKRIPVFKKLGRLLKKVNHSLSISWPIRKPYLPKAKVDSVWKLYNYTKSWYDDRKSFIENSDDCFDLKVLPHEITEKINDLENWYNETKKFKPIIKPKLAQKGSKNKTPQNEGETIGQSYQKTSTKTTHNVFDDDDVNKDIDEEEEYYDHDSEEEEDNEYREPQIIYERKIELNDAFIEQASKLKSESDFNDFSNRIDNENNKKENEKDKKERNDNEL